MTYKKVGGIHFVTLGRLGVNFYVKKAKASKKREPNWFQRFAMSRADQLKLEMELAR